MGGTTKKLAPTLLASLALASGIAGLLMPPAEAAAGVRAEPTTGGAATGSSPTPIGPGHPGSPAQGSPSSAAGANEGGHPRGQVSSTPSLEPEAIVSQGPITLQSDSATTLGQTLAFTGQAPGWAAGGVAAIERYARATGTWVLAGRAAIDPQGAFVVRWHANITGRLTVRAVVLEAANLVPASAPPTLAFRRTSLKATAELPAAMTSDATEVTVYKPATASWYGPGFYGKQTACGQTMTTSLIGVANRKLPCGTLVAVSYEGRSLTVPVVDRGPYAAGAQWDLTAGAAEALGVSATVRVGTLLVGSVANRPLLGSPLPVPGALTGSGGTLAN